MSYEFKSEPFDHQLRIFKDTVKLEGFALLWEQGCAKTKPIIDTACAKYEAGEIDAVLVVAPPGVERNWKTDEIPAHMPDRLVKSDGQFFLWETKKSNTKYFQQAFAQLLARPQLIFLFMNYSSFMTKNGKNAAWKFLKRRRVLYVLDESDDIKTPNAKRTKSIISSGKYAPYRRIMTGTPADKPFDLYSQLRFIDPDIWKRRQMANFYAFKQHYGVWFTREQAKAELGYDPGYDKLIEYKNLDELAEILSSVSDRLLKEDVFDLPPKLYTKRYFDMTTRQRSLYEELKQEFIIEFDDGRILDGDLAIVRLLRLQQITCGYMVTDAEEPLEMCDNRNPRLEAQLEFLEKLNHQSIVWCRFLHDVEQITHALGKNCVRYDGTLTDDECEENKMIFNGEGVQHFVATTSKGSRGLTMNVAKTTSFYSNDFKYRNRIQAEDRNHRYGQDGTIHSAASLGLTGMEAVLHDQSAAGLIPEQEAPAFGVLYADFVANNSIDSKIISNLRAKFDVATQLTGDKLREWI